MIIDYLLKEKSLSDFQFVSIYKIIDIFKKEKNFTLKHINQMGNKKREWIKNNRHNEKRKKERNQDY